jgi:hypothetical protein
MAIHAPGSHVQVPQPARQGSVARPISGRLYRLAWVLVLVPLVILALSVTEPSPLTEPSLPASFDAEAALADAETFSSRFPDRLPGGDGNIQSAAWVADQMAAAGLTVEQVSFEADLAGLGRRQLINVVGSLPPRESGRSSRTIVVVAHRDNDGLSPGTLQIARQIGTTSLDHTLVFVSLDGASTGNAGAVELAASGANSGSPFSPSRALAVVNLDTLGVRGQPRITFGGDGGSFASPVLVATADARVVGTTASRARVPGAFMQLLLLAAPVTLTDEAPLAEAGISAVTLSTADDEPLPPDANRPGQIDVEALRDAGTAAQSLVGTLDGAADVASGTAAYVYLGGRALRGWAIALTLLAGLLPVMVAAVDLLARCRRRGLNIAPGLRGLRSRIGVVIWLAAAVYLLAALDVLPSGTGGRALRPDLPAATTWDVAALVTLGLFGLFGYAFAWPRLRARRETDDGAALAGHAAAMIALCVAALATAFVNPFALIFVLPSLHAWLWLPQLRDRPAGLQLALYLVGFVGPAFFIFSLISRFGLGADSLWYALTLVSTRTIGIPNVLLLAVWCACAMQIGAVLLRRYAPYPPQPKRRFPSLAALTRRAG